jgi:hypothetical protein
MDEEEEETGEKKARMGDRQSHHQQWHEKGKSRNYEQQGQKQQQ